MRYDRARDGAGVTLPIRSAEYTVSWNYRSLQWFVVHITNSEGN
jgi:hypothetical protein